MAADMSSAYADFAFIVSSVLLRRFKYKTALKRRYAIMNVLRVV